MSNNDSTIEYLLNYLNKTNPSKNKKRSREISRDQLVNQLKNDSIKRFTENYDLNIMKKSGIKLVNLMTNLSEELNKIIKIYNQSTTKLQEDIYIDSNFLLIADLLGRLIIYDEIKEYSILNKKKNLIQCIEYIKQNLTQYKFQKIPQLTTKIKEYEEDSLTDSNSCNEDEILDDEILDDEILDDEILDDIILECKEEFDDELYCNEEEKSEKKSIYQNSKDPNERDGFNFINKVLNNSTNDTTDILTKYYLSLPINDKIKVQANINEINNYQIIDKPAFFKIMDMPLELGQKNTILQAYKTLTSSDNPETKLHSWFNALMTIPFGKFKGINIKSIKPRQVKTFLNKLILVMDKVVYGHNEAKRQIIQMMGQQLRNPKSKGNMLGIWGPPGNGKCFALNTLIMMYSGENKKVQDIKIGDIIMGDDSQPRNVLSLGNGSDDLYEIQSSNGDTYTVNSDHILCLKTFELNYIKHKNGKFKIQYFNKITHKCHFKTFEDLNTAHNYLDSLISKEKDDVLEITVKDYLKLSKYIKLKLKGYKVGLNFKTKSIKLDSYIMGTFLGNDNSDNIFDIIEYYNLVNNKYIPTDYKINDRITRLKLLAGIVDTCGNYNIKNTSIIILLKSEQLSKDLVFLIRTLGFSIHHKKTNSHYYIKISGNNLEEIPTQYVHIYKNNRSNIFNKNMLVNNIKVKSKGYGDYYGFMLDGNNRFLLGDFTVTHNTTLIKEGIAKAMDKPFVFISLGGATDSAFLEGHSYTYEGSICGRIVNGLITSKSMDPIIYFDELDKISRTAHGEEISNILIHLTDPVQNSHFRDKYFHGIDIDLSRATMIFSFNDPSNINPILLDRITTVETKYLLLSQKIHITNNYLLPNMISDMGLNKNDISIDNVTLTTLINNYTYEGGVRKLKSLLYNIIRELNVSNLIKCPIDNVIVKFPFNIESKYLKLLLKHKIEIEPEKIHTQNKSGFINGLYCGSLGVGGILPIQVVWMPTNNPLTLKATGNLQKVIKESADVACSLAWNYLSEEIKITYLNNWKNNPMGFHIHCPDGSVPKDGPSAGAALTIALYSLLTNQKIRHDIAITGEINLEGNITAIGGLEEKLEGAKKAGVKLVLFPKENLKHLEKIKERNPELIDTEFNVISIETFNDVLKYSLIE
jgi:ATP-dependent Lon protease